ncbi:MAG: PEP/pyruvate-binding domain-containing protein [Deltaproteobacteria bacterium]
MSLVVPIAAPEAADARRFGPKAANLAALTRAGLPTPGGFAVDADAYQRQMRALGLEGARADDRRRALEVRMALLERPVAGGIAAPLLEAWRAMPLPGAVRSSALVEDRAGASFAGQFESYLGLSDEGDLLTAVRACWAALWSTRALRYMASHGLDPADTAMAVIVQPLVKARVSGGGLSRTAEGCMLVSAAPGPGSAVAQGAVVPDQYLLDRSARLLSGRAGRRQDVACHVHGRQVSSQPQARCLADARAEEVGRLLARAEDLAGGPVEIEWALDDAGVHLLQSRPLRVEAAHVADETWTRHPGLTGLPAGIGRASGRACVVGCECELSRVGPGDVLVTRVAGPSLVQVLPRVSAVVAELGGSTSHLASLARERGIPMVLGVRDATARIPDGVEVAVDGVAGIVRFAR